MIDKENGIFWFIICLALFSMFLYGGLSMERYIQRRAVKANAAYWTVDENGFTKFH